MRELAEYVFGKRWIRPLAEALGVDKKQAQRWAKDEYEISDERLARLEDMARDRVKEGTRRIGEGWKR